MATSERPDLHGGHAPPRAPDHRHRHRARLYVQAVLLVGLLLLLVLLVLENTQRTEISWVFGSTRASVIWIVAIAAAIGWVLGLLTAVVFRRRTRARAG